MYQHYFFQLNSIYNDIYEYLFEEFTNHLEIKPLFTNLVEFRTHLECFKSSKE